MSYVEVFKILWVYFCAWCEGVFYFHWCYMQLYSFPSTILYSCLLCQRLIIGFWVYIWVLYSVPLVCMSVFVPVPHCLGYCSFVVKLQNRKVWVLRLCFCFSTFFPLAIQDTLYLQINFRNSLSVSVMSLAGIVIRITLNL